VCPCKYTREGQLLTGPPIRVKSTHATTHRHFRINHSMSCQHAAIFFSNLSGLQEEKHPPTRPGGHPHSPLGAPRTPPPPASLSYLLIFALASAPEVAAGRRGERGSLGIFLAATPCPAGRTLSDSGPPSLSLPCCFSPSPAPCVTHVALGGQSLLSTYYWCRASDQAARRSFGAGVTASRRRAVTVGRVMAGLLTDGSNNGLNVHVEGMIRKSDGRSLARWCVAHGSWRAAIDQLS
jgi:hypothetical protein